MPPSRAGGAENPLNSGAVGPGRLPGRGTGRRCERFSFVFGAGPLKPFFLLNLPAVAADESAFPSGPVAGMAAAADKLAHLVLLAA